MMVAILGATMRFYLSSFQTCGSMSSNIRSIFSHVTTVLPYVVSSLHLTKFTVKVRERSDMDSDLHKAIVRSPRLWPNRWNWMLIQRRQMRFVTVTPKKPSSGSFDPKVSKALRSGLHSDTRCALAPRCSRRNLPLMLWDRLNMKRKVFENAEHVTVLLSQLLC